MRFTDPLQQFEIDHPESYVLEFMEDGSIALKADCNQVTGAYTTYGSSISIELGPATLAACQPGSRGEDIVRNLPYSSISFFEDEHLFIDLFADGGTFEFAPVEGN